MKKQIVSWMIVLMLLLGLSNPVSAKENQAEPLLQVSVNTYSNRQGIFALDGLYRDNVFYISPTDICAMTGARAETQEDGVVFSLHQGLRLFSVSHKGVLVEKHGSRRVEESIQVVMQGDVLYISAPDILSYMGATVDFGPNERAELHMLVSMPYTVMDLVADYGTNGGYAFSWAEAVGKRVNLESLLELAALDTIFFGYDSNVMAYALPGYSDNVEKAIHADALLELLRNEGMEQISTESLEVEILGFLSDDAEVSMSFLEKTMEWAAESDLDKKLAEKWSGRMDSAGLVVDLTAGCIASLESAKQFANLSNTQKNLLQDTLCRVSKQADLYSLYPEMFEAAQEVAVLMTGKYSAGEKAAWDAVYSLLGEAVDALVPPNPVSFAFDTLVGIAKIDPLLDSLLSAERNLTFASECADIRVLASRLFATDTAKFDQNGKYAGKKTTTVQENIKQDMILSLKASLTARLLILDTGWLTDSAQNTMQQKADQTARLLNMAQNARPVAIGIFEENEQDISWIAKLACYGSYGNVVKVGGDTYYWRYDADSFRQTGMADFPFHYTENELVCRAENGKETVIFSGRGQGAFVVANGWLFYEDDEANLRSIRLDGTQAHNWGYGYLCDVSENGRYVIYSSYSQQEGSHLRVVDVSKGTSTKLVSSADFVTYHNGLLYYTTEVDYAQAQLGKVSLHSIRLDGTGHTHLYTTEPDLYDPAMISGYGSASVDQIRFTENYVYFSYGCVAGSGSFFQGAKIARVRYDGTGGEVVAGQTELVDGQFTVGKNDVVVSEALRYIVRYSLGNPMLIQDGSVYLYDQSSGQPHQVIASGDYNAVGPGLVGESGENGMLLVAFAEVCDGKVYYLMHYATENTDAVTWREPYVRQKTVMLMKDLSSGKVTVLFQC